MSKVIFGLSYFTNIISTNLDFYDFIIWLSNLLTLSELVEGDQYLVEVV